MRSLILTCLVAAGLAVLSSSCIIVADECDSGEWRCDDEVIQECVGGEWEVTADCLYDCGGYCGSDVYGNPVCVCPG